MGRHMAAWNILQKVFCFAYWFSQFGSCFFHLGLIQLLTLTVLEIGVLIDRNLSFAEHISHIVTEAHPRACLIHIFLSRDTSTLVRAFTTYVRPLLEYCLCIWSPHFKNGIYKVEYESVQRNFTKRLRGMSDLLYCDRLVFDQP